jgi:hypothetical protein
MNQRELELFRQMVDAGVLVGVPAALHFCIEHVVPAPGWLLGAAMTLLCDLLKREKSTQRGRARGAVARYRQDMVDFIRWNEVLVIREKQVLSAETVAAYSIRPGDPMYERFKEEVARHKWLGRSLSDAFECVSEMLERTDAHGSPDSIKRSYRQVERNHRHRTERYRYCLLHPLFLKMLGIEDDLGYGRGAKIAPWSRFLPKRDQSKRKIGGRMAS